MKICEENLTMQALVSKEIILPDVADCGKRVPSLRPLSTRLYGAIAKEFCPKSALEIGTAQGYSTLLLLLNAPSCIVNTIDICDQEGARENVAKYSLSHRVNFICANAIEAVPKISGQFDLILLDGAKSQYVELLPYLVNLLAVGGVLVCDNVNYMGLTAIAHTLPNNHKHITIARNMAKFMENLFGDDRLKSFYYDVEDGMTLSIKK